MNINNIRKFKFKDNVLLVPFDCVVDLDYGIWKFIKDKFKNSNLVNKELLSIEDDDLILTILLFRECMNPLDLLILDSDDNTNLLQEIMSDDNISTLLEYSKPYDTLRLMGTFLDLASSVAIDILCENEIQSNYIKKFNNKLNTIIFKNKAGINLNDYSALYIKYFKKTLEYQPFRTKHVYIPMARYNMQKDMNTIDLAMNKLISEFNRIHLIDLYQNIKYRF